MNCDGPGVHNCDAGLSKGEEMGWFEHGSTIIVVTPRGFSPTENVCDNAPIRMGQPLMHIPQNRVNHKELKGNPQSTKEK